MEEFKGIDEKMLLTKKERNLLYKYVDDLILNLNTNDIIGINLNIKELNQLKEKVNYFHK